MTFYFHFDILVGHSWEFEHLFALIFSVFVSEMENYSIASLTSISFMIWLMVILMKLEDCTQQEFLITVNPM